MKNNNIKSVCVFASSSDFLEKSYYEDAASLGELLAAAGMDMVYGGSTLGLMWACANAVKSNGGKITGVMPQKLCDFGVSSKLCDEFHLTTGMRERKAKMDELSDSLIALAGGFGTLEELAEMIVQKQLGYNNKAIVILNTNNFYDKLIEFFDVIISQNFCKCAPDGLYYVAQTPEDAVEYLKNYTPVFKALTREELYAKQ